MTKQKYYPLLFAFNLYVFTTIDNFNCGRSDLKLSLHRLQLKPMCLDYLKSYKQFLFNQLVTTILLK